LGVLILVHTVTPLIAVFNQLCARILPTAEVVHVLDEPLLKVVQKRGKIEASDIARLKDHVAIAAQMGARAVLVTCSTISPLVDHVRPNSTVPVYKIDEAMVEQAVERGTRIGVLATVESTLEPTRKALESQARIRKKKITVQTVMVTEALQLLTRGQGGEHDALVRRAIDGLSDEVDLIVLAQATIARVLEGTPLPVQKVPILASPHLALQQMRTLF
jgi:Asp/Glu/hydantoin racemase